MIKSIILAAMLFYQPDPVLTPGVVATTNVAVVCHPGYAKSVRHTSNAEKSRVYRLYGVTDKRPYVIDHLISLELGGADVIENMWPELVPDARKKDRLENYLHYLVCTGRLSLTVAQHDIAHDWNAAYRKYLP